MKKFLDKDFLLETETAKMLYHEYAETLPIIDYHCHLDPKEIAEDRHFSSLTEIWLGGDHYKWRAMRSAGVKEKDLSGDASARDKFERWAETLPLCIGNPLYHWTHLELRRFFNVDKVLSPQTADAIWTACQAKIQDKNFSSQKLIETSNVEMIGTTDDPLDDLSWHKKIKENNDFKTKVLPTFRPDKILNIEKDGFCEYITKLSNVSSIAITDWTILKQVIKERVDYFHLNGCRLSDHAFEYIPSFFESDLSAEQTFYAVLNKKDVSASAISNYKFELMKYLGFLYNEKQWVMQLHIGALRDVNPTLYKKIGPDTGFDVISDRPIAQELAILLGRMEESNSLPKTILYNLNPNNNFILATLIGAFQEDSRFEFGKIQFGSGWWYNDQKAGMIKQLTDLANLGVLGKFIGMLTDSRSFLSYPRHEYFRRIFCNLVGQWVENGEYPNDGAMLKKIVQDVCYYNAKEFLGL